MCCFDDCLQLAIMSGHFELGEIIKNHKDSDVGKFYVCMLSMFLPDNGTSSVTIQRCALQGRIVSLKYFMFSSIFKLLLCYSVFNKYLMLLYLPVLP